MRGAIGLVAVGLVSLTAAQRLPLQVDQLPLNAWHDLRVELLGARVIASVAGKLRIEHNLPAPVSGRVGFYTKRDSVTAFKAFTVN